MTTYHYRQRPAIDAVAVLDDDLLRVVCTAIVDGQRAPVCIAFMGRCEEGAVEERMDRVLDTVVLSEVRRIEAEDLRSPGLQAVMEYRRQRANLEPIAGNVLPGVDPLSFLDDAVIYVRAMEQGLSPALAIAESRGCTKRTAEGRIQRARKMGLLTAADGRRLGGSLTPRAKHLLAERNEAARGHGVD